MKWQPIQLLIIVILVAGLVSCGNQPDVAVMQQRRAIYASKMARTDLRSRPDQKIYRSLDEARLGLNEWEYYYASQGEPQAAFFAAHGETLLALQSWMDRKAFHDNPSMERYAIAFANEARRGLDAYYEGRHTPEAWRLFADSGKKGAVSSMTSLLLGINAHVNRDLPHAILKAGVDPASRLAEEDHAMMLTVLMEAAPIIRHIVIERYQPEKQWLNTMLATSIDYEVKLMFREARTRAWTHALRLKEAKSGMNPELDVRLIEQEIEDKAAQTAEQIITLEGQYARQLGALRRAGARWE